MIALVPRGRGIIRPTLPLLPGLATSHGPPVEKPASAYVKGKRWGCKLTCWVLLTQPPHVEAGPFTRFLISHLHFPMQGQVLWVRICSASRPLLPEVPSHLMTRKRRSAFTIYARPEPSPLPEFRQGRQVWVRMALLQL